MAAVVSPNLGIYKNRSAIALNERMLQDGRNFRVKEGVLSNLNLGWERFEPTITLNGAVTLIDQFFIRGQSEKLIFGTPTDLYVYNEGTNTVSFINPIYDTGTASASGTAVTGVGTNWDPEAKAGDQIHFGAADYHDPTGTWYTILSRTNDTTLTLTASAGTVANGPYTIRKTFTGNGRDVWVTDTFVRASPSNSDEWWATNGVDGPVRWNGTSPEVEVVAGLSFTSCKSLRVYQNMMIFANVIQGGTSLPQTIINSNVGEPQNTATGLSEQFVAHSGTDEILTMEPLGDTLAIYSENNVTLAQFVGDPVIFAFRKVVSNVGVIAPRAVAVFGDHHRFIGRVSEYLFDGASVREVGQHVWRDVLRQQDPIRTILTYHHFDDENAELIWVVPSTTDPNAGNADAAPSTAHTEHYLEEVGERAPNPMSIRDFPFTATGYYTRQEGITWNTLVEAWQAYNFRWNDQFFFASFPLNLAGDATGKLWTINTVQDADGAALASYVRFGRRAIGDGKMRGLVRRVYPFISTFATPATVTTRYADHAMGAITTTQENVIDQSLPEGGHFVSPFRRGRFVELQYGSAGPGQPWQLHGYDIDLDTGGRR